MLLVAAKPRQETGAVESAAPLVALFPDESSGGAVFPWERTYELAGLYSRLYREAVETAAPALARLLELPPAAARVYAREALVPLCHFYLDRLLRLERLLTGLASESCAVAEAAPIPFPARAEDLRRLAQVSAGFNQLLLSRQAALWGIETKGACPEDSPAAGAAAVVNRLFDSSTAFEKIRRLALIALRRCKNRKGLIPVLSMAYSTGALKNAGFYSSYLADLRGRLVLDDGAPAPALREALRAELEALREPFLKFLGDAGFRTVSPDAVFADFAGFAVAAWPSSILEAARENLERAARLLEPFKPRPLIIGERGDLESIALIAAAKVLEMPVISFQHGGHGGYLSDIAVTLEMEQWHSDVNITWGWTRLFDYPPPPPGLKTVALPNPFLSERAKRWRRTLKGAGAQKPHDFLLLSNGLHRFTPAPGGAAQSTIDFLHPFAEQLIALAREAGRRGVKVLHKPRDPNIASLLAGTYAAMEREGGASFRVHESRDKGMTKELLDSCRVVLWDQPGMGFQECLAAGIPTMCLWTRLYNREEKYAASAVAALETAGVIHKTTDSLFAELERFKKHGGEAWMSEPARAKACADFARAYGWADDDWTAAWERFFDSLP